jgi:UDP-glucuronate 4-epimerase
MKILVTGAAGFIGSALCKKLSDNGNRVIAIDNFSDYYDVSLKYARVKTLLEPLNLDVIDLDICSNVEINSLISKSKPDIVINLAAQAGVRLPREESNKYVSSNLVGFSNVLYSTVDNKVPFFVYASSSSVYGNNSTIPYSEGEQNLHPTSFYGATKLANELLTPTLIKNSATTARGLRYFTVYGPWGRPDMAYFRMIANVISGAEFNLFGDGTIERDFTYIDDIVDSTYKLILNLKNRPVGSSDIVNIGGGRPLSINYLLEQIQYISGKKIKLERLKSDVNDVNRTVADATYIESLIGTKPSISLEIGLTKTIKWAEQKDISSNLNLWVKSVL